MRREPCGCSTSIGRLDSTRRSFRNVAAEGLRGSDCPFFLDGGVQLAGGRGEVLKSSAATRHLMAVYCEASGLSGAQDANALLALENGRFERREQH